MKKPRVLAEYWQALTKQGNPLYGQKDAPTKEELTEYAYRKVRVIEIKIIEKRKAGK